MKLITTKDGSHTLYIEEINETYHSTHGAIQEAKHVFIENGIKHIQNEIIGVLEVGFGTGLNALLTQNYAEERKVKIQYTGLEPFPLEESIISELNYSDQLPEIDERLFSRLHACQWNERIVISDNFLLEKFNMKVEEFETKNQYDIIYFDTFGPRAQEEMWGVEMFKNLFKLLVQGGRLVTYCAQGQFKRNLKSCGFEIISLPGPPGKREMTVGIKQ